MSQTQSKLMQTIADITFTDAADTNLKRENANINSDTAMGTMLQYGSAVSTYFCHEQMLDEAFSAAHKNGDIHIHDLDFMNMGTLTCCQIDLLKLFSGGFSTGHGYLREPNDIASYAALAAIAIQSNQNDQHGGQSIPFFDYALADGVRKTFRKSYMNHLRQAISMLVQTDKMEDAWLAAELKDITEVEHEAKAAELEHTTKVEREEKADGMYRVECLDEQSVVELLSGWLTGWEADGGSLLQLQRNERYASAELAMLQQRFLLDEAKAQRIQRFAYREACKEADEKTFQAMEAFIHNLNTMHSRAGAQVPFSSINFGTDVSAEGRMVSKNLLRALERGLGNGETAIFPIVIFKVKQGINYEPEDPNYDLFQFSCKVSAKRLFPNFSFLDAPFNLKHYVGGRPETEAAYMGCRTRVLDNVAGEAVVTGRGNLSFTTINLPRLGIKYGIVAHSSTATDKLATTAAPDLQGFYSELDRQIELVTAQLLERMKLQGSKRVKNFPFLMGQHIWRNAELLDDNDSLAEIIKQGTLTLGFIGLAECLKALLGVHHGENEAAQRLGLEIITHMRKRMDAAARSYGLNFSLIATPAEGLSGRFTALDRAAFGVIAGITDRQYYTNSFHVPVYYKLSAYEKINKEAPYHALCNGGHITYVELDGDPSRNLQAFEVIVRAMKEAGIGYGSINHPIDRDPLCGYSGVIKGEVCPGCGRSENDGAIKFERIRRITGYLVGTLERFNNAKRAEVHDRIKHL